MTALSVGGHDQAKANDKQITRVEPAPATLPAPAPASASPAVKPGVPKPLAGDPAPVPAAGPDSNSHPAPLVAPVPIVVEPPSRTRGLDCGSAGRSAHAAPDRRSRAGIGSGGGRRWQRLGQARRRPRVPRPTAVGQPCRTGRDGQQRRAGPSGLGSDPAFRRRGRPRRPARGPRAGG